jgi:hypothetical protein
MQISKPIAKPPLKLRVNEDAQELTKLTGGTRKHQQLYLNENNNQKVRSR